MCRTRFRCPPHLSHSPHVDHSPHMQSVGAHDAAHFCALQGRVTSRAASQELPPSKGSVVVRWRLCCPPPQSALHVDQSLQGFSLQSTREWGASLLQAKVTLQPMHTLPSNRKFRPFRPAPTLNMKFVFETFPNWKLTALVSCSEVSVDGFEGLSDSLPTTLEVKTKSPVFASLPCFTVVFGARSNFVYPTASTDSWDFPLLP